MLCLSNELKIKTISFSSSYEIDLSIDSLNCFVCLYSHYLPNHIISYIFYHFGWDSQFLERKLTMFVAYLLSVIYNKLTSKKIKYASVNHASKQFMLIIVEHPRNNNGRLWLQLILFNHVESLVTYCPRNHHKQECFTEWWCHVASQRPYTPRPVHKHRYYWKVDCHGMRSQTIINGY